MSNLRDQWHEAAVLAHVAEQTRRNLERACLIVERDAKRNVAPGGAAGFKISHGAHGLRGSITHEVEGMVGRIGSNLHYARIHEIGGVIRPDTAKALAIPVKGSTAEKRGIAAKNWPDPLFRIGHVLYRAGQTKPEALFILMRSVRMPARPYLRPALDGAHAQIRLALMGAT